MSFGKRRDIKEKNENLVSDIIIDNNRLMENGRTEDKDEMLTKLDDLLPSDSLDDTRRLHEENDELREIISSLENIHRPDRMTYNESLKWNLWRLKAFEYLHKYKTERLLREQIETTYERRIGEIGKTLEKERHLTKFRRIQHHDDKSYEKISRYLSATFCNQVNRQSDIKRKIETLEKRIHLADKKLHLLHTTSVLHESGVEEERTISNVEQLPHPPDKWERIEREWEGVRNRMSTKIESQEEELTRLVEQMKKLRMSQEKLIEEKKTIESQLNISEQSTRNVQHQFLLQQKLTEQLTIDNDRLSKKVDELQLEMEQLKEKKNGTVVVEEEEEEEEEKALTCQSNEMEPDSPSNSNFDDELLTKVQNVLLDLCQEKEEEK
ncbi:hypothetical protein SNEBB_003160 [Seison nebaliae]|nr:hypothetical protein SNEBB_003160 [Seison nebaliae]